MGFTVSTKKALPTSLLLLVLILNFSETGAQSISSSGLMPVRNLAEAENVTKSTEQSDDTVRVDPLDHLRQYRGGYDIRNKHYWSSTVFTGIPGYALGVLWLLCGLIYGAFLLAMACCCASDRKLKKKKTSRPYRKQTYVRTLVLAIFIELLAITATGIVLGGTAKFHWRARKVVDIIIDTADNASETLSNATGAMKDMRGSLDPANVGGGNAGQAVSFLTSTSSELDSRAADIERQARKNRHNIYLGLKIVYIVTVVTVSFNLAAVIALSAFGVLKRRNPLLVLIALCWLIAAFCWIFFGAYFFVGKFAGDTCTAFEGFQQDPYNNSLSSILPCDELISAESVLSDVSAGVYNLVNQVNANISSQAGSTFQICNPISAPPQYNYQPENCSDNAVRIGDIPRLLRLITCIRDDDAPCNGGISISTSDFRMVEAYTTSIQNLLNNYQGLESLVQCQTVKDAFSEILQNHCKPLKRDARMVWSALVFLSIVMVLLVLTWTFIARHERIQQFSDGSVKPHSTATIEMESESHGSKIDKNPYTVL